MPWLAGQFIVLDGGEGCGKSTQLGLLRTRLESAGVDVVAARDPGTTAIGEKIRAVLLDVENTAMSMRCEMLLYMAARAQMMKEIIRPALFENKCVLCDRFVSSTLAYQTAGGPGRESGEGKVESRHDAGGLDVRAIRAVAEIAIGGRWPDLTVLLDMPPEEAGARIRRRKDRIERRPIEYHRRVRQNYLDQAVAEPARFFVVDARQTPAEIHEQIFKRLESVK